MSVDALDAASENVCHSRADARIDEGSPDSRNDSATPDHPAVPVFGPVGRFSGQIRR